MSAELTLTKYMLSVSPLFRSAVTGRSNDSFGEVLVSGAALAWDELARDSCKAALVAAAVVTRLDMRFGWLIWSTGASKSLGFVSSGLLASGLSALSLFCSAKASATSKSSSDMPLRWSFLLTEPAEDLPECNSMCAKKPASFNSSVEVDSKMVSWLGKREVTEFQCTWTRAGNQLLVSWGYMIFR